MRIRFCDSCVEECTDVAFMETSWRDGDSSIWKKDIFLQIDNNPDGPDGKVNLNAFESYEEGLNWAKGVCDHLMTEGYYDFRNVGDKLILY